MDEYEVEMTCVRRYTYRVQAPTREEAMMIANHNHLVGASEKRVWQRKIKRLCGFQC